jgi:hypothetical protein
MPLCLSKEDAIHTLLKYLETKRGGRIFISIRSDVCENLLQGRKKIINCTNVIYLKIIEEYLFKSKHERLNLVKLFKEFQTTCSKIMLVNIPILNFSWRTFICKNEAFIMSDYVNNF